MLVTADQLADWTNSWSMLPVDEYLASRAETTQEEVHIKSLSKIKIPGRNSMLVDLGSKINAIGMHTEEEFARAAAEHGHEARYIQRKQRLHINGVGSDAATCDYEAEIPVAIKFDEQDATHQVFRANIAQGCGANLPAILGADSMREKDSVLILRQGKEMIAFPGPGGYKIEWSPGTKLLPMIPAPSGHLVIPCDRFEELPKGKERTEQLSFCTDHFIGEMRGDAALPTE
jgi:hypothetical protein